MFKNLSINTKLFAVILAELIISTFLLATYSVSTIKDMSNENIQKYETQVMEAKKEKLQEHVDMAKAILQLYRDKVTPDTTSKELEHIKKEAIDALDSMTYGDDDGYIFVWTYDGVPLAFNPRPDLIGKKLLNLKGGGGQYVIKDHIENAKKGGGHFYEYKWKTTKESPYQTKLSYSFGVQDWEWFVGTGEYLAKEEKQIAEKKEVIERNTDELITKIIINASILVLITSSILFYIIRGIIFRPLAKLSEGLSDFFEFLQNRKKEIKPISISSNDEIGKMSEEINESIKISAKSHQLLQELNKELTEYKQLLEKKVEKRTQKIKKQKEEFETVFHYTNDGLAIVDLESRFLECNKAFLDLTEYDKTEIVTKTCAELTLEEDREKNDEALKTAIEKGFITNIEKSCITKNGQTIAVNMSISLLPDKKRLLIVIHDISQLKLMQEQAKMASMGEMIGNIAHQWRQPLSIISTAVSGMKIQKEIGSLSDEEFVKCCESVDKSAQYLSKTIDDFKNFIKGESSQVQFNLSKNLDSFLLLIEGSIKTNHIHIVKDIDETILVTSYPNELIQCYINIFNNAKDAMENLQTTKYIFIRVYLEDNQIAVSFKDNGGGIPLDVLPHIFEPYFTTKHKAQGTGLGLSMTYNMIVEGLKGTIEAKNVNYSYEGDLYSGAEFVIKLPKE